MFQPQRRRQSSAPAACQTVPQFMNFSKRQMLPPTEERVLLVWVKDSFCVCVCLSINVLNTNACLNVSMYPPQSECMCVLNHDVNMTLYK